MSGAGGRLPVGVAQGRHASAGSHLVGFMQTPFYLKYPMTDPRELTLRRLYHQRVFGMVGLFLATLFMWLPTGFYSGLYLGPTAWLIPFVFFVVVEVYTVFRISAVEKG